MNLFGLGLAMLGCSFGMCVGAIAGHLRGYEQGQRDAWKKMALRLKDKAREEAQR